MAGNAVSVIGLGAMGSGLATQLLARGFEVTVHNRTPARAEEFRSAGAKVATSVAEAVGAADQVVLSLSDEAAVDQVLDQAGTALRPGTRLVDTSTVSPAYSRKISTELAARGVHRLEACLLGNPAQSAAGMLRVLAAGPRETFEGAADLLAAVGREVSYLGPVGNAACTKLVFNLLLGGQLAALAEAVNYGVAAGLDRERLLTAIEGSGFSSKVLDFRAERMRTRAYRPAAFKASLMAKDLRLGAEAAAAAGVDTPVLAAAWRSFDAVVGAGEGDADAAVVIDALGSTGEGP
jgi:3-hydroxyisobutyrate dehydrogenase-like beta-hydroxyacid dehydrogenase